MIRGAEGRTSKALTFLPRSSRPIVSAGSSPDPRIRLKSPKAASALRTASSNRGEASSTFPESVSPARARTEANAALIVLMGAAPGIGTCRGFREG